MDALTSKMNKLHILMHSTFQLTGGIIYGFAIYSLIERGYSSFEAGLCFAFVNLINLVLTPIISNYLDNNDEHSVFDIILFLVFIVTILMGINYFLDEKCLLLTLVFIIGGGCFELTDPIINSISSKLKTYKIDVSYSFARAVGSASYGLVCFIFGFISSELSYSAVILGGIAFSMLYFVVSLLARNRFNSVKDNYVKENKNTDDKINIKDFCKNNVLYIVTCVFIIMIFIGYSSIDHFMLLVCENVGGSSKDMGYLLGFKALMEVIPIFAFPYILKRFKLKDILIISAIAFICKSLLFYLATNVFTLYLAQVFQAFSFAFMTPGMVVYVNNYLKRREVIRGVSFYSLSIGIGGTISSLVGGFISDSFGISAMNLFALGITIVGAIGYICAILYRNKHINA